MAHIGLKHPVAAKRAEGNSYTAGFVIAKAISFTGTPDKNDVELYADDELAETDKSMKRYTVSLKVDDLSLKVQADLLGHTYTEAKAAESGGEATPESMEVGADDVAPFFGVGFYRRRRKNNVTTFTATWLYNVQFGEPTENAETKGETTNFQTPTIEGEAYPTSVDGRMTVGRRLVFNTEAEAKAWLDKMAKIEG